MPDAEHNDLTVRMPGDPEPYASLVDEHALARKAVHRGHPNSLDPPGRPIQRLPLGHRFLAGAAHRWPVWRALNRPSEAISPPNRPAETRSWPDPPAGSAGLPTSLPGWLRPSCRRPARP